MGWFSCNSVKKQASKQTYKEGIHMLLTKFYGSHGAPFFRALTSEFWWKKMEKRWRGPRIIPARQASSFSLYHKMVYVTSSESSVPMFNGRHRGKKLMMTVVWRTNGIRLPTPYDSIAPIEFGHASFIPHPPSPIPTLQISPKWHSTPPNQSPS